MEPNVESGDTKYEFGSIIADKSTWALFAIDDTAAATLASVSISATVDGQVIPITFDDSIDSMLVTEQDFRCVVGKAMDSVATFLEQSNVASANGKDNASAATNCSVGYCRRPCRNMPSEKSADTTMAPAAANGTDEVPVPAAKSRIRSSGRGFTISVTIWRQRRV
jgi:hypothetical protein